MPILPFSHKTPGVVLVFPESAGSSIESKNPGVRQQRECLSLLYFLKNKLSISLGFRPSGPLT